MKKILDWLVSWDKDKVLHFAACFLVSLIAACIAKLCGGDALSCMAAAWFFGFGAGVAKEMYDEWKYQGADEADWAADIVGIFLGSLMALLLVV